MNPATKKKDVVDRLLRACATGYGCRALISRKVLLSLDRDLWPGIARAIIELLGSGIHLIPT